MARKGQDGQSRPLERYVRILELLTAYPEGLIAGEIEQILHFPKTTTHRLLHALAASELIVASGKRLGGYSIGTRLNRVLHSETGWIEIATRRRLKELADLVEDTCFISRRFDDEIRSVAMESPDASVGIYVTPGHDLPWHATASGKLLAAFSNKPLPMAALKRYSPNTTVDRKKLEKELEKIRTVGYATEQNEHVVGLATIAVLIDSGNEPGISYGLGVTGPHKRVMSKLEDKLVMLRAAAKQFSKILNVRRPAT